MTGQQADALKRLRLFNAKVQELGSYSFISKAFHQHAAVALDFDSERKIIAATRLGADNEARAAACLILRMFLQPRDRIELRQIAGLYQDLPVADGDKQLVEDNLRTLEAFLNRETELALNGAPITYRTILETFLYGDQAHANQDKRQVLETWKEIPPIYCLLENTFEYTLCEIIRYISWQAALNKETIKMLKSHLAQPTAEQP